MAAVTAPELFDIEMHLLLEAVYQRYGFDFRQYAPISLRRRVRDFILQEKFPTLTALTERLLHDPECMNRFLNNACVGVSSMFRDPEIFQVLRERVVPILRTYPFIKVWHAGCSTGEEVYSTAIFLREEGLLERSRIYATDISEIALKRAQSGCFSLNSMREYAENYHLAGGKGSLLHHCTPHHQHAVLHRDLLDSVIWGRHNLVTDASFNTFHLVFCRNVLMYFNNMLQSHVHRLLYSSLEHLGFLVLGKHENVQMTSHEADYKEMGPGLRIYKKVCTNGG